jgi:hypothetical protein
LVPKDAFQITNPDLEPGFSLRYDPVMGFWSRGVIWSARKTLLQAAGLAVVLIVMDLASGRGMEFVFSRSFLLFIGFLFCLSLATYPIRVRAMKAGMAQQQKFREIEAKFRKARLEREARARAANSCNPTESPAI